MRLLAIAAAGLTFQARRRCSSFVRVESRLRLGRGLLFETDASQGGQPNRKQLLSFTEPGGGPGESAEVCGV